MEACARGQLLLLTPWEQYNERLNIRRDQSITDIAPYSQHFNELLEAKVTEIFSPDTQFTPTRDLKPCRTCPYAKLCRTTLLRLLKTHTGTDPL